MNAAEYLLGEGALALHGGRTALVCGKEHVTFGALAARTRRAASAWRFLGASTGDRVLIRLRDTPDFAAAWLGALYAGCVAIAVNGNLSAAEQRHMFEDSDARLFLTENSSRQEIEGFAGARCISHAAWRRALDSSVPLPGPAATDAGDPAFWLYSSGTTGRPKGIVHAHKDVIPAGNAMREVLGLSAGDTVFATSKLFFAYGLEHGLLGPLSLGASSVLHPDAVDAVQAAEIVNRTGPTAFFSVPSFYRRLLALEPGALAQFRAIRHFVAAGERLPVQVLERWRATTGGEILSLYGMSETFCVSMMTPPGASDGVRTGRPIAGVETRLVNDNGVEAMPGEQGVLWIRHPAMAKEYANRPQASSEQFVDGWFCTRDLFIRDEEGFFSHQGRADELIKIAGQWVQPGELEEAAIAEGSIAEAACVRVNDSDGFERLALFVTAGADPDAAIAAAVLACEKNLARHKRPKWIRAVAELPRTATGKVQRFKLRELIERELAG